MIIAIDFDRTFTADPELWKGVISLLKQRGHEVIMLTWRRHSSGPEFDQVFAAGVQTVLCTGRQGKKAYAEKINIKVDIWIDDNPESIVNHG